MLKLKLKIFGHLMGSPSVLKKDLDAGKNGGQKKGTREDEMVDWHHRFNGYEF